MLDTQYKSSLPYYKKLPHLIKKVAYENPVLGLAWNSLGTVSPPPMLNFEKYRVAETIDILQPVRLWHLTTSKLACNSPIHIWQHAERVFMDWQDADFACHVDIPKSIIVGRHDWCNSGRLFLTATSPIVSNETCGKVGPKALYCL